MKLLIDTHVLIWWLTNDRRLSSRARTLIQSPENAVFVSAASVWELRIKEALDKITLPDDFTEGLASQDFEELAVTFAHAHALLGLPMHHRDPFDRMLIVQAQLDGLTLLTHDEQLARYEVPLELV